MGVHLVLGGCLVFLELQIGGLYEGIVDLLVVLVRCLRNFLLVFLVRRFFLCLGCRVCLQIEELYLRRVLLVLWLCLFLCLVVGVSVECRLWLWGRGWRWVHP